MHFYLQIYGLRFCKYSLHLVVIIKCGNPDFFVVFVSISVDVCNVISRVKFCDNHLRDLGLAEGKNLSFPIDFDGRLFNTRTLPHERVVKAILPLADSSCIKYFVFTRWQHNSHRMFEISDRF